MKHLWKEEHASKPQWHIHSVQVPPIPTIESLKCLALNQAAVFKLWLCEYTILGCSIFKVSTSESKNSCLDDGQVAMDVSNENATLVQNFPLLSFFTFDNHLQRPVLGILVLDAVFGSIHFHTIVLFKQWIKS